MAAGIADDGTIHVLADGLAPHGWANAVVALFDRIRADLVVGWRHGVRCAAVDRPCDTGTDRARNARQVAARIKHVDPPLEALEDQMCDVGINGLSSGASPDRSTRWSGPSPASSAAESRGSRRCSRPLRLFAASVRNKMKFLPLHL